LDNIHLIYNQMSDTGSGGPLVYNIFITLFVF